MAICPQCKVREQETVTTMGEMVVIDGFCPECAKQVAEDLNKMFKKSAKKNQRQTKGDKNG